MRILQVAPSADPELARTLLGIQHAAYALEAILIDDDRIPALHEDVEDLRSSALIWLAAFVDRRLVGAVGWRENDEALDIDRLVVAPEMHRHGVGSALIREVLRRAGNRRIVVSTGRDNTPARKCTSGSASFNGRRGSRPRTMGDAIQLDGGLTKGTIVNGLTLVR